jgi:hypothetical protein
VVLGEDRIAKVIWVQGHGGFREHCWKFENRKTLLLERFLQTPKEKILCYYANDFN